MYKLPITNTPNQRLVFNVPVNGENRQFELILSYNTIAEYWTIDIKDFVSKDLYISGLPLLCSFGRMANILAPYACLGIGSLYVAPINFTPESRPTENNLGSDYVLLWGDNGE
jgi:hypothetical protein